MAKMAKTSRSPKKSVRTRRASSNATPGGFVFADVSGTGTDVVIRRYVSPKSSESIHRSERTYGKALKRLARR